MLSLLAGKLTVCVPDRSTAQWAELRLLAPAHAILAVRKHAHNSRLIDTILAGWLITAFPIFMLAMKSLINL